MQNLNQFKQKNEAGMIALEAIEGRTLQVRVDPNYTGDDITPATAVKLVPTSPGNQGKDILVTPTTDTQDIVMGMVAFSFKKTAYKAGDYMEIFVSGKIIYANIGSTAVEANDTLVYDPATKNLVPAGGFPVTALALDAASANTIGRVVVKGNIY